MNNIEQIFDKRGIQEILRGDIPMLKYLKKELSEIDKDLSPKDFNNILDNTFDELIKKEGKFITEDYIHFKILPQHGMSGGTISLDWWQHTVIPLLKERYLNRRR